MHEEQSLAWNAPSKSMHLAEHETAHLDSPIQRQILCMSLFHPARKLNELREGDVHVPQDALLSHLKGFACSEGLTSEDLDAGVVKVISSLAVSSYRGRQHGLRICWVQG